MIIDSNIEGVPIPRERFAGPVNRQAEPVEEHGQTDLFQSLDDDKNKKMVLLQIDGFSHTAMKQALKEGYVPNIKSLLDEDNFVLNPFRCGIPTVTVPVLSALFYNIKIPGNDWYDKVEKKHVQGVLYEESIKAEADLKGEKGLLRSGVVISSALTGGSDDASMTASIAMKRKKEIGKFGAIWEEIRKSAPMLKNGDYSLTKVAWNFVKDMISMRSKMKDRGLFKSEKDQRIPAYISLDHVGENVACAGAREAIKNGVPRIYADFVGYDDTAHYFGPYSKEAMEELRSIDESIGKVVRDAQASPNKYEVVVFSDHGQTPSKQFHRLFDKSAGDTIKEMAAKIKNRQLGEDEIVFTDVYSLGNIYFNFDKDRVNLSRVEVEYPGLVDSLNNHPGIGLLCGMEGDEIVILGKRGSLMLSPDNTSRINGENPLTPYGDEKILQEQIARYMPVKGVGDIVIFGAYDSSKDEVIDFNDKYSFNSLHGGIGGDQTKPFVITSADSKANCSEVTDATQMHDKLTGK